MRVLALRCDDESDAELRRLWAEYQERDLVNDVAWEASDASRDDLERSLFDGETIEELSRGRGLSGAERQRWVDALDVRHPDPLWEAANAQSQRLRETLAAIRATPAEGLFGIAVKLAALPSQWQGEDVEDSALAALGELNRMLGTAFSINGKSRFEEYADEDEAEGDALAA